MKRFFLFAYLPVILVFFSPEISWGSNSQLILDIVAIDESSNPDQVAEYLKSLSGLLDRREWSQEIFDCIRMNIFPRLHLFRNHIQKILVVDRLSGIQVQNAVISILDYFEQYGKLETVEAIEALNQLSNLEYELIDNIRGNDIAMRNEMRIIANTYYGLGLANLSLIQREQSLPFCDFDHLVTLFDQAAINFKLSLDFSTDGILAEIDPVSQNSIIPVLAGIKTALEMLQNFQELSSLTNKGLNELEWVLKRYSSVCNRAELILQQNSYPGTWRSREVHTPSIEYFSSNINGRILIYELIHRLEHLHSFNKLFRSSLSRSEARNSVCFSNQIAASSTISPIVKNRRPLSIKAQNLSLGNRSR